MNGGYLRLSRDDDKKNYPSIEHQQVIIERHAAAMGMTIDKWYIDDGYSGYSFNRPGFIEMTDDLENDLNILFSKDFSRIGRHNAKVLLLLEDFKDRGKRLILVDDDYDTIEDDDDIIGIKTWYNERYVKDASKKVKKVIRTKQEMGTLFIKPHFGYDRENNDKIIIIEDEAEIVRKIFYLYKLGNGYKKIAEMFNIEGIPTPSQMISKRYEESGNRSPIKICATTWSANMIRDILKDDFYIGTYRTHKRERKKINGTDIRVPKDEQFVFSNHHEPIIDKIDFDEVQNEMVRRIRHNYRGVKKNENIFREHLKCADCKAKMIPITRTNRDKKMHFICHTYNVRGKLFCDSPHDIKAEEIIEAIIVFLTFCRDSLYETISRYDITQYEKRKKDIKDTVNSIEKQIDKNKNELKQLLIRKNNELISNENDKKLIEEMYSDIQNDMLLRINSLINKKEQLAQKEISQKEDKKLLSNAIEIIDRIIETKSINSQDIDVLIDKIYVSRDGSLEINLKYGINEFIDFIDVANKMARHKNIMADILVIIDNDDRDYTSAKFLDTKLKELDYKISKKTVVPYLNKLIDMGVLEKTDNPLKPYNVIKDHEELLELIEKQYAQ